MLGERVTGSAINDLGQVTGAIDAGSFPPFLYSNGQFVALDHGFDSGDGIGLAINNAGQITGQYKGDAFFSQSGGITMDLGSLGGGYSAGFGINNLAQVTGDSKTSTGAYHAFLYSNGVMTDLNNLIDPALGATLIRGTGINDGEAITGLMNLGPSYGRLRAFVYINGNVTDLGTLGGTTSDALAINNSGQVTGYADVVGSSVEVTGPADTYGSVTHAFLYSSGVMTDLGSLGGTYSAGEAINNNGQVTGYSALLGYTTSHAFVYSNGVMSDLNSLIDPSLGVTLTEGVSINNHGQILALGTGYPASTYLLTPLANNTPEPATFPVVAIALVALSQLRRFA